MSINSTYLLYEFLEATLYTIGRFCTALDIQGLMPPGKLQAFLSAHFSIWQIYLVAHYHLDDVRFIAICV